MRTRLLAVPDQRVKEDLAGHYSSLMRRLRFLVEACERGAIEALKSPNNDTEDRALYHVSYLCVLATAALEDIAWILCHYCGLILHRRDVTLRRTGRMERESGLTEALSKTMPSVYRILVTKPVVEFITALFDTRDVIQHREHPQPVGRIGRDSRRERGHFVLSSKSVAKIASYCDRQIRTDYWPVESSETLVDPYSFALGVQYGTAKLANTLFSVLPWNDGFPTMLDSHQQAARAEDASWESRVGVRLQIGRSSPLLDMP